jgi:predicted metal-dependent HD superfamily phosphohydrolase
LVVADNEEQSAALAESTLARLGAADRASEVARLVRLTRTHAPGPGDHNGQVLCDADLAILGAGPAGYATYAAAVRNEYRALDEPTFRAGRSALLAGLLARPTIFSTKLGSERWETAARRNIESELTLLGAQTTP